MPAANWKGSSIFSATGSVFAVSSPGHTAGSMAYAVRTTEGPVLLTGDTCHARWGWENAVEPGTFTKDNERNLKSLPRLESFGASPPGDGLLSWDTSPRGGLVSSVSVRGDVNIFAIDKYWYWHYNSYMDRPRDLEYHVGLLAALSSRTTCPGLSSGGWPPTTSPRPKWVALRSIHGLGACSLSELAERMGSDPSTVSRLVERVLRKGLAARAHSDNDRRRVRIELTKAGRALGAQARPRGGCQRRSSISGICRARSGRRSSALMQGLVAQATAGRTSRSRDHIKGGNRGNQGYRQEGEYENGSLRDDP